MGKDRENQLIEQLKMYGEIIHNMVVGNQAAWIEWKHGKGAEAAMKWVHNGLAGPGNIPDARSEPGQVIKGCPFPVVW